MDQEEISISHAMLYILYFDITSRNLEELLTTIFDSYYFHRGGQQENDEWKEMLLLLERSLQCAIDNIPCAT